MAGFAFLVALTWNVNLIAWGITAGACTAAISFSVIAWRFAARERQVPDGDAPAQ